MKRILFGLLVVLGMCALGAPAPAGAVSAGEHIATYDVTMTIRSNGLLDVTEVIGYDFSVVPRHGIFRDIPDREAYDAHHLRKYDISNVKVSASAGTPSELATSQQGNYLHLRVGDPDTTITGPHTYTISYTVAGALRTFNGYQELSWDAVGTQWPVSIDSARVAVLAPANITQVACYTGPQGSTLPCDAAAHKGARAAFAQDNLAEEDGMTVVIGLPPHTITPDPQPMLTRIKTLADAFSMRPDTLIPGGLLALLGIGAVSIVAWRRGRDRRYSGSATDAAFGNTTGAEQRVGVGGMDTGPVEFVPPDNVRPGQIGTLVDEHANLVDVTATIIDLAVRGWLTIAESGKRDYTLTATAKAGTGTLLPYETALMNALFATGSSVSMSDLKYKFRSELTQIQNAMYDDMVTQGWYHTRPDRTRVTWSGFGLLATLIAIGITVLLAIKTSYGVIGVALVLVGIALLAAAGHMPARTPKGSAMLSRVKGFRRLFDEGDQGLRERFAENHNIFSEYLPYAIVFGCAKKWAKAFEGLGAEAMGATSWYSGSQPLNAILLANEMDHFGTVATGTMYASQPSSSSSSGFGGGGFSGGGGGGGGGGSW